ARGRARRRALRHRTPDAVPVPRPLPERGAGARGGGGRRAAARDRAPPLAPGPLRARRRGRGLPRGGPRRGPPARGHARGRPDRGRRGRPLGEGAAALVLEDAEHARARGARARAALLGHGTATDAHHPTAPHPEGRGALAALRAALAAAELPPEAIDYVNAHGTGTPQNNAMEVGVLRAVLGPRLARVPLSATKSQLGHCLGAAGAIEAAVTVLALDEGIVP